MKVGDSLETDQSSSIAESDHTRLNEMPNLLVYWMQGGILGFFAFISSFIFLMLILQFGSLMLTEEGGLLPSLAFFILLSMIVAASFMVAGVANSYGARLLVGIPFRRDWGSIFLHGAAAYLLSLIIFPPVFWLGFSLKATVESQFGSFWSALFGFVLMFSLSTFLGYLLVHISRRFSDDKMGN